MGPDAVYMTPPPSVQYSDAQWVSMGVTLCSPVLDLSPSYLPPLPLPLSYISGIQLLSGRQQASPSAAQSLTSLRAALAAASLHWVPPLPRCCSSVCTRHPTRQGR